MNVKIILNYSKYRIIIFHLNKIILFVYERSSFSKRHIAYLSKLNYTLKYIK